MNISSKQKGILFILLAGFGFALMGLFVNLAGSIPTIQKAFFRNIVPVFIAGAGLRGLKGKLHIDKGILLVWAEAKLPPLIKPPKPPCISKLMRCFRSV